MKHVVIVVLAGLSLAGGSLFVTGCSKSTSSNSNSLSSPSSSSSLAASKRSEDGSSASAPASAMPAKPVDMKLKWRVGRRYNMEMDTDQSSDIDMDVAGEPIQQGTKMTQDFHYSVLKELNNGAYQMRMEFDRLSADVTRNGMTIRVDTAKGASADVDNPVAPVAAALRATVGAPLDFTISAAGALEKFDGLDNFTDRIIEAVPDPKKSENLVRLFDADTLKEYANFSDGLPGHPVAVGDSWTSTKDVKDSVGEMTVSVTHTFKNWEEHNGHNCMHLLVNGDIRSKGSLTVPIDGATVKLRQGAIFGESWFDPNLGTFEEIESEHDITLDITIRQKAVTEHVKRSVDLSLRSIFRE